jgi:hypothetical protein
MKAFHEMTKRELFKHLRALYQAQPRADWDKLAVGNIIVSKYQAWRITRIPPKRGFLMAEDLLTGETEKLLRSKHDSADLLLSDEATIAVLRTVHREEIEKAMAAGIHISPVVQYDYPEVFTPYPVSWDEKRREKAHDLWLRINEMGAFREHLEGPGWQYGQVDHLIEEAEKDIARWKTHRAEVAAGVKITKRRAIPVILSDVDRTISGLREEIEILHHLRRHVEKTVRPNGDRDHVFQGGDPSAPQGRFQCSP